MHKPQRILHVVQDPAWNGHDSVDSTDALLYKDSILMLNQVCFFKCDRMK